MEISVNQVAGGLLAALLRRAWNTGLELRSSAIQLFMSKTQLTQGNICIAHFHWTYTSDILFYLKYTHVIHTAIT